MNNTIKYALTFLFMGLPLLTFAGAGHDHGPVPGEQTGPSSGPVQITPQAKANLRLEVAKAEMRFLAETLFAIGQIDAIPARHAQVSSRISGRVINLLVTEGETVEKDQLLARVESRQPGNPPPVLEFHSPRKGVVVNLHVFEGSSIEPDTHLLDVIDLSEVYARAQVYEGQLRGLALGQNARIRLEAFPGKVFQGTLEKLSAQVDPANRTLPVWFRVANPDNHLRLNMRATFHIVLEENAFAISVPREAVLGDHGKRFVFVETDAEKLIYEKTPVVTGLQDDRFVEIIQGVFIRDRVVTAGNYQLQYIPAMPEGGAHDHDHAHEEAGAHAHGHEEDAHDEHGHSHHGTPASETPAEDYRRNLFWGLLGFSVLFNLIFALHLQRHAKRTIREREQN